MPQSQPPSVQDLLAVDTRPVPAPLLDHEWVDQGTGEVPRARYTSPVFAELENEYLWTRTWQMACMEVDVANAGDYAVYDVADQSLLVVRTDDGLKAYHNSCLHRGTKLRTEGGRASSFRCPFHGWRWDLEGTLIELPAGWDFPQIENDPLASCLPEAQVATWGGFVFVNMDPGAEPFETYAAKLIEHFGAAFDYGDRYRVFHAVKEVPANWKVCMEAFSEAYHVIATHPQILEFCADTNSQYSMWAESPHVTRFHNPFAVQSPHLDDMTEQEISESYHAFRPERAGGGSPDVPPGSTARAVTAQNFRDHLGGVFGRSLENYTDAEVLDAILYHLFPAFAPWAGVAQSLVYRWRPGPTPDTSFMDVLRLQLKPEGQDPAPGPITELTLDQRWEEAPGMGSLAAVFEQDMANIPKVQQGLKSRGKAGVSFSQYQEGRLRHIHRLIDTYIEAGLAADGRDASELDPFRVEP